MAGASAQRTATRRRKTRQQAAFAKLCAGTESMRLEQLTGPPRKVLICPARSFYKGPCDNPLCRDGQCLQTQEPSALAYVLPLDHPVMLIQSQLAREAHARAGSPSTRPM